MSTDFIGLFDITLEEVTPEWLLERFVANPPDLADIVERWRDRWTVQAWTTESEPWFASPGPQLRGPGGFWIHFESRILELYHTMRFSTFTGDPIERTLLRRACRFIADLVGSSQAIYTHELMRYEGESLKEIEANLRERIGPPAKDVEELHAADLWGPRAWYVDTFSDL